MGKKNLVTFKKITVEKSNEKSHLNKSRLEDVLVEMAYYYMKNK